RHAHQLRHVLGRGRRRRGVAGKRRRAARPRPGDRADRRRLRPLAAVPPGRRGRPRYQNGGCPLVNRLKAIGAFWYDFVAGDDWQVAALVVAGLALTAVLTHAGPVDAWGVPPVVGFA